VEITVSREYDFIPEWSGNKQDGNPIVFKMRMLSTGERDKLMGYEFSSDGRVQLTPDRQGMFNSAVVKIENLKVNGESLISARQFLACPGLDSLFAEAVAEIMGKNAKEDSKN